MHPMLFAQIASWSLALLWLGKLVEAALGLPQVPNLLDPLYDRKPQGNPRITIIVPARDEAAAIAACLESLLGQDYQNLQILAVDDRSSDATGQIIDSLAARHGDRLTALHIAELPAGWLGKTHAMALAARHAISVYAPEYLLFCDADIFFCSDAIRRSLAEAVEQRADHFVTMPTPLLKSSGEAMLLGYIQVMGLWATRPWKVSDPWSTRDSVGIGAFNMLRTDAYEVLGGFDALRLQILEDVTLGRSVKLAGLRQRVAFAPGMVTLHWASGTFGVVNVMTKNLFALFRFRTVLLLLGCSSLAFFCLGPVVALGWRGTRLPGLMAVVSIVGLYRSIGRFSRIPVWTGLLFPISTLLFLYSMLKSMFATLRQGGVTWRGTFYSLAELRRNVAPLW